MIISSFFFNPIAKAPIVNATVPLDNVIAYFLFDNSANFFSNFSFVFPGPKKFYLSWSVTYLISVDVILGSDKGIIL